MLGGEVRQDPILSSKPTDNQYIESLCSLIPGL